MRSVTPGIMAADRPAIVMLEVVMSTAVPAIVALPVGLVIMRTGRTVGIAGDVGGPRSSDRRQSGCRIDLRAADADRRDARLRQVDLAKRLGWQQAYVSRYETGERQLSVDEYVAVALAIGV